MNLSETDFDVTAYQEFFMFLKNKRDSRALAKKRFTLAMVRDIPDSIINSLDVEDITKVMLHQRKRELVEEAQAAKDREKSLRDRKPKLNVYLRLTPMTFLRGQLSLSSICATKEPKSLVGLIS